MKNAVEPEQDVPSSEDDIAAVLSGMMASMDGEIFQDILPMLGNDVLNKAIQYGREGKSDS